MGTLALQAAAAILGDRQAIAKAIALAMALSLGLLVLIAAPLALLSADQGAQAIPRGGGDIPAGLVPVFNEAARVYQVNAYLLASIADQESTFGTGPSWRTVNSAGCVGLMQMCVGGRAGDSWTPARLAYRRGHRPDTYDFATATHPDILDSFDNVMAAAVHLRGKVGGQPIPDLDDTAYRALCGYYGACADGVAGDYAGDVLARARSWQRQSELSPASEAPSLGGGAALAWPVRGPVTSPFCESRAWERCHPGIDIGVPSGTPILAAADGRVAVIQSTAASGGYGNFTCLAHSSQIITCYAHQQRILVRVGQSVARGQEIGISDCTGRCYGPHLHFEVRVDGHVVCPARFLGVPARTMCAPGAPTA